MPKVGVTLEDFFFTNPFYSAQVKIFLKELIHGAGYNKFYISAFGNFKTQFGMLFLLSGALFGIINTISVGQIEYEIDDKVICLLNFKKYHDFDSNKRYLIKLPTNIQPMDGYFIDLEQSVKKCYDISPFNEVDVRNWFCSLSKYEKRMIKNLCLVQHLSLPKEIKNLIKSFFY